jgi:hypothetical protein
VCEFIVGVALLAIGGFPKARKTTKTDRKIQLSDLRIQLGPFGPEDFLNDRRIPQACKDCGDTVASLNYEKISVDNGIFPARRENFASRAVKFHERFGLSNFQAKLWKNFMAFISDGRILINLAFTQRYSLPSFNVCSLEMARACVMATDEERAPIMLQTGPDDLQQGSPGVMAAVRGLQSASGRCFSV